MSKTLKGIFQDSYGETVVSLTIDDDGNQLKTTLRDVEFFGYSLDKLSPIKNDDLHQSFSIDSENHLHSFKLLLEFPIIVMRHEQNIEGLLKIDCVICAPEKEWEENAFLQFTLIYEDKFVQSDWCKTGFEDELYNLESKLSDIYLKCCFNCEFAAYNPYWNSGLMGELTCFVNAEDKYAPKSKGAPVWEKSGTAAVQELHLCPDFQPRNYAQGKR